MGKEVLRVVEERGVEFKKRKRELVVVEESKKESLELDFFVIGSVRDLIDNFVFFERLFSLFDISRSEILVDESALVWVNILIESMNNMCMNI